MQQILTVKTTNMSKGLRNVRLHVMIINYQTTKIPKKNVKDSLTENFIKCMFLLTLSLKKINV